ncbi:site-specific DNA-methyltransferase [Heliobacterium chlorum]|uniref:Site-specific DNA-methyltransferase n=1 Tax=Heliobacterium chlorum TaxID=2698 RepID=A0ABR7T757_HELCL|nr:site-specific DNA-methyltransferase [Heliobacterium chlorum]MBC9786598.1 site-specific DNA-methyltransferase [Heliobacterium chlorum]
MKANFGDLTLDTIHHMDINDRLKLLPDSSIDLIIADPPYGINYRSGSRKRKFTAIQNDNIIMADWLTDAFLHQMGRLCRVVSPHRPKLHHQELRRLAKERRRNG